MVSPDWDLVSAPSGPGYIPPGDGPGGGSQSIYQDFAPDVNLYDQGQVWVRTTDMKRFELYIDEDSRQWVKQGTSCAVDGQDGEDGEDITAITGFKNVVINGIRELGGIGGTHVINQRGFDGDWSGYTFGEYGWDRWAFFDANFGGRMYQRIERNNVIQGETYTLSWDGGGECHIRHLNGNLSNAAPSPYTFILAGSENDYMDVIVPVGSTNIQLERGEHATEFEMRSMQQELAMCQRYYFTSGLPRYLSMGTDVNLNLVDNIQFPQTMRTSPSVTLGPPTGTATFNLGTVTPVGAQVTGTAANEALYASYGGYTVDAEL